MKTHNAVRCRSSAFTLIELLVVIGLIGLLAGGLGVAMKNKNPGSGLRSAQSVLVSLLSSARGQSALNQANAMILVQALSFKLFSNSWSGDELLAFQSLKSRPKPAAVKFLR